MCTLGYPPEIQKLVDTFDPYRKEILSKNYSGIIRRMFTMEGSEGLSTYIPNGESNSKMNTFYRTLSWYSAAGWNATGW